MVDSMHIMKYSSSYKTLEIRQGGLASTLGTLLDYRLVSAAKDTEIAVYAMERVCIIIYHYKCYCELSDAVNLAVTAHDLVLFTEMQKNLFNVSFDKYHSILDSLG
jgi:hypothetical protein